MKRPAIPMRINPAAFLFVDCGMFYWLIKEELFYCSDSSFREAEGDQTSKVCSSEVSQPKNHSCKEAKNDQGRLAMSISTANHVLVHWVAQIKMLIFPFS
jgi:hypothetical protein